MSCINKVFLLGLISSAPQYERKPNGFYFLTFTLITKVPHPNLKKAPQMEYHNILMTDNIADMGYKTLWEGKQIYLEGTLKTASHVDGYGIMRYTTNVVATRFYEAY